MMSSSFSIGRIRSLAAILLTVALFVTTPDERLQGADKAVNDLGGRNLAAVELPGLRHRGRERHKALKKKISLNLSIPPLLEVSSKPVQITFNEITGPGVYDGDKVAEVSLSTNTTNWSLICDSVAITAESDDGWAIPPERIRWKMDRLEPVPHRTSGYLSSGMTLLFGHRPVEDIQISISFSIEILPTDPEPATTYNLHIGLTGKVNDE